MQWCKPNSSGGWEEVYESRLACPSGIDQGKDFECQSSWRIYGIAHHVVASQYTLHIFLRHIICLLHSKLHVLVLNYFGTCYDRLTSSGVSMIAATRPRQYNHNRLVPKPQRLSCIQARARTTFVTEQGIVSFTLSLPINQSARNSEISGIAFLKLNASNQPQSCSSRHTHDTYQCRSHVCL